jgi:hypothetical protein
MKANLYINYYVDKNASRQAELEDCVYLNLLNEEIDKMIVILSQSHVESFKNILETRLPFHAKSKNNKIVLVLSELRPTYNDFFILSHKYSSDNEISIIANTDIFFDYTISLAKKWHWNKNYCMALCRWDITETKNTKDSIFFNRPDSQDVWIVKGKFNLMPNVNFGLGVAGCDNSIAYLLSQCYEVINPSMEIKTHHLHLTEVRNYIIHSNVERLPPPYHVIHPTNLIGE